MIVQGESEGERSGAGGAQAPVSDPLAEYLFLDGADPIPAGYRSQSFSPTRRRDWDSARLRDFLGYLEAAIGIEPMNKGFAVRPGRLSLSVMECDRPVFIDLF